MFNSFHLIEFVCLLFVCRLLHHFYFRPFLVVFWWFWNMFSTIFAILSAFGHQGPSLEDNGIQKPKKDPKAKFNEALSEVI